jgi:hypothetical protein
LTLSYNYHFNVSLSKSVFCLYWRSQYEQVKIFQFPIFMNVCDRVIYCAWILSAISSVSSLCK